MKLVELLARELGEWPENVAAMVQERNGRCHGCQSGDLFFDASDEEYNSAWYSKSCSWWPVTGTEEYSSTGNPGKVIELADDYRAAIVTREQWQAERDRKQVQP